FSEKLNLAVDYFNPLRNVQLDPGLNREELAKSAHSLGEVVGLGLRNLARCPVDLNLMPKSSKKRQEFSRKKPFLAAAALCLILIVFASGFFYQQIANERAAALEQLKKKISPLKNSKPQVATAAFELTRASREAEHYGDWLEDRLYWGKLFMTVREALMNVEDKKEKELGTPNVGVWVEKWAPILPATHYLTDGLTTNALLAAGLGTPEATPAEPAARPNLPGRPPKGGASADLMEQMRNRRG